MKFTWRLEGEPVEVGPGQRIDLGLPQLLVDEAGSPFLALTFLKILNDDTIQVTEQPVDPQTSKYTCPQKVTDIVVPPSFRYFMVRGIEVKR